MSDRTVPEPLTRPVPRAVRINGDYLGLFIGFSAFAAFLFMIVLLVTAASSHKTSALKERGVTIMATVTSYRLIDPRNQNYMIDYRFDPPELSNSMVKSASGEFSMNYPNLKELVVGHPFRVIYDPLKPDRSMPLAYFRASAKHSDWPLVWVAAGALGLPMLVWGSLLLMTYRHQRRLLRWGKFAPATVVDEQHYRTRGGPIAKVTYAFEDDKGVTVTGRSGALPVRNDPLGIGDDRRARYLANPIAVYDPGKSRRNLLYPGSVAHLAD
jgi:hypothetical protein